MNYLWWIGMLMFLTAGALLHDVPFLRFLAAMLLVSCGTTFAILSESTSNHCATMITKHFGVEG